MRGGCKTVKFSLIENLVLSRGGCREIDSP